jgi:hypothetical protein
MSFKTNISEVINALIKHDDTEGWLDSHKTPTEEKNKSLPLCNYCGIESTKLHSVMGKSTFDEETLVERDLCDDCIEFLT